MSGVTPDVGRMVPAWLLSAVAFGLAMGITLPQWGGIAMTVAPTALFVTAAAYPKPGLTLPSLALVVLSVVVGQHGLSLLTFLFVAGIHALCVLYGITSLMRHRARISAAALALVGRRFLLWQVPAQLLALLAFLTAPGDSPRAGHGIVVLAVAGAAALVGLALLWRTARAD